jgi:hypothetical protein
MKQTHVEICNVVVDLWNKTKLQNPPNQVAKQEEVLTKLEIRNYLDSLEIFHWKDPKDFERNFNI